MQSAAPSDPQATNGASAAVGAVAASLRDETDGVTLLLSDTRTAFMLINEGRLRALQLLFGVSKDQANLATLVVCLLAAHTARDKFHQLVSGPSPSAADGALGGAALREVLCGVAGLTPGDAPILGGLLMIAVLAGGVRPGVMKSLRGIGASSRRLGVSFHHRYGYLVDPGHARQRRSQRREDAHAVR